MNVKEKFVFTSENLLDNLDKLGAWSSYGLAIEALAYYFPDRYGEDNMLNTEIEVELMEKLGCNNWQCIIEKYHKEVGYKNFNPEFVNEF